MNRRFRPLISLTLLYFLLISFSHGQPTIRVMQYNLLGFGDCNGVSTSDKYQWLGTILEHVQPDIFTVNELNPQTAYINGIKALSFDYSSDIDAFPYTNQANSNIVNTLFYDKTKFQPLKAQPDVIPYSLRDINVYHLLYLPSIADGSTDSLRIHCIVAHFKAGQGSSDASLRTAAANAIMNYLGNFPDEELVLVMGDFNVYSHQDEAFQRLVNGSPASERLIDVTGKDKTGWNGGANARFHTQSTRSSSPDCGSGGGMDDRFDFILASQSLIAPDSDIRIDSASYQALGNNGQYYNTELGCSGNSTVPFSVCLAMKQMSDHLPVVVDLNVNSSVSIARSWNRVSFSVNPTSEPGDFEVVLPYPSVWKNETGSLDGRRSSGHDWTVSGSSFHLNLGGLPAGMYWIRVTDQRGNTGIQKVVWQGL